MNRFSQRSERLAVHPAETVQHDGWVDAEDLVGTHDAGASHSAFLKLRRVKGNELGTYREVGGDRGNQ